MPDAQPASPTPPRRRRRLIWCFFAALILLAGAWGYWQQALVLRETGFYHKYADSGKLITCGSGFLLRLNNSIFVFYNWHGQERWRVDVAPHYSQGKQTGQWLKDGQYVLCPNGRDFSFAVAQGCEIRTTAWRDGRFAGKLTFPFGARGVYQIIANPQLATGHLDEVLLVISYPTKAESSLFLIEQDRVVARGKGPSGYAILRYNGAIFVSLQEKRVTYYSLALNGVSIAVTRMKVSPSATEKDHFNGPYAGGVVIDDFGWVFQAGKRVFTAPGFQSIGPVSANGRFVLLQNENHFVAYEPMTGKYWSVDIRQRINYSTPCFISEDGKWIVIRYSTPRSGVLKMVSHYNAGLRDRLEYRYRHDIVDVYRRPGVLYARLQLPFDHNSFITFSGISPDGKAMLDGTSLRISDLEFDFTSKIAGAHPEVIGHPLRLYRRW